MRTVGLKQMWTRGLKNLDLLKIMWISTVYKNADLSVKIDPKINLAKSAARGACAHKTSLYLFRNSVSIFKFIHDCPTKLDQFNDKTLLIEYSKRQNWFFHKRTTIVVKIELQTLKFLSLIGEDTN